MNDYDSECNNTSLTPLEVLIKKVYKKVALKYHPDKNKDKKTDDIFKSISKSYENKNLPKLLFFLNMSNLSINLNFSPNEKEIILNEKEKLDKKIKELTSSVFYNWDKMNDSQRETYMNYFKKLNGI